VAVSAHDEPNLVPLLDLVLQLVMFFMVCTNFVMEQVDQTILLPVAQSARPMAEAKGNVVFLNVDPAGRVLAVGRPRPLDGEAEVDAYLRAVAEDAKRRGGDAGPADTLVILRAHRDAEYATVYRLLRKCQEVGLKRLQLRAYLGRAE
jgi:biopolymer transport protein ExbD